MAAKQTIPFKTWQKAVGNCPMCGRVPTWFNDVPLTAFCWGEPEQEHQEVRREVPGSAQPYGKGKKQTVWKSFLRQKRKATLNEYRTAELLYQTTGMAAVLSFAKSLGIKSWSQCKGCEIKTPDTTDDCCLVCGMMKGKTCQQKT